MGFFDSLKQGLTDRAMGTSSRSHRLPDPMSDPYTYAQAADMLQKYNAYAAQQGVDRRSPDYYQGLVDVAMMSGNPFLMNEYAQNKDWNEYSFNAPIDPMLTNDRKDYLFALQDPQYGAWLQTLASNKGTKIQLNPYNNDYSQVPVDKDMLTKIKWVDGRNTGRWATYGDLNSGAAYIADDSTTEQNKDDLMTIVGGEAHTQVSTNPRFNSPSLYASSPYKVNQFLQLIDPTESNAISNALAPPDIRELENNQRAFNEFGLRVASGGQVKKEEYGNWDVIFWPGVNATQAEIDQKAMKRALVLNAAQQHSIGKIVGGRNPRDFYAGKSKDGIDMFVDHRTGALYKGNMVQKPSN